jgi:UDP-N-acetylglucosamine 2-epimerase (non-hydrolysing)
MLIDIIAGARPNFIKISPLIAAIRKKQNEGVNIQFRLIHTGQHYDKNMSDSFFEQLDIPNPDFNLGVGSGTQAEQTAGIMVGYESILLKCPSNLCVVVGDVTSTMACAIASKKLLIPVAHIEGGIRSGDMTMPEEINRIVTDSITDIFFTTTTWACENLLSSGVSNESIHFVGNVMIDTLRKYESAFSKPRLWDIENLSKGNYFVLTLHRPANVDAGEKLKLIISEIIKGTNPNPVIFPVHPRTRKILDELEISFKSLKYSDPLSYLEFNYLVKNAKGVITDSGGITEETTVMGVPCITLRDNTERPETCTIGTNELIGTDPSAISPALKKVQDGNWKLGGIPEKWDGKAAERIVDKLILFYDLL